MAMNKKAQVVFIGLMLGIIGFMAAMVFIDPMTDVITEARDTDQLNCSSTTISDGRKATCLLVDLILPAFIGVCVALAGAYITAKFI
jgi:hypothetical protein